MRIKLVVHGLDGLLTMFLTVELWQRPEGDQTEGAERGLSTRTLERIAA